MRDGKVALPVTEWKKSFVDELTYYGLEMRDEDIDDGKAQNLMDQTLRMTYII